MPDPESFAGTRSRTVDGPIGFGKDEDAMPTTLHFPSTGDLMMVALYAVASVPVILTLLLAGALFG